MKRLAVLAALALAACVPSAFQLPPPPADVANSVSLDETIARGAEVAYKAQRTLGEIAVDAGLLKGASAFTAARIDNACYKALQAVRTAYRAGNAADYVTAGNEVARLTQQLVDLVHGAQK